MTLHHAFPYKSKNTGFTLIEMVVTVAIVGILAAIAVPSYRNYVVKGHVKGAGADLVALALIMENQHQLTMSYPATSADVTVSPSSTSYPGFGPAETAMFKYSTSNPPSSSYLATHSSAVYLLTATGRTGTMVSGCTLTLDSTNARYVTGGSACGGLTTW